MRSRSLMIGSILCATAGVAASPASAGVFREIVVDGNFSDWAGIAATATDPDDRATPGVDFASITLVNDADNLYVLLTLHENADPFTFISNTFFDTDDNGATGFQVLGGLTGSEMLIQAGAGYDERNGGFNEGDVTGLEFASAGAGSQFEFTISRSATYADATNVFTQDNFAILFETEESFVAVDTAGPVSYTFAVPEPASALLCGIGGLMLMSTRRR